MYATRDPDALSALLLREVRDSIDGEKVSRKSVNQRNTK